MYNIVRYYFKGRKRILFRNVTLEIAQLHCRDKRTRQDSFWFDGYEEVKR